MWFMRFIKVFGPIALLIGVALAAFSQNSLDSVTTALREKNFDAALQLLQPLLQQSPGDARLWALQGIALSGQGHTGEALSAFQRSLKFSPDYLAALQGAAQIQYQAGNDAAGPLLEHILRLRPNDQTSHAMLGVIAYRHRDCQRSAQHFEQSGPLLDSQVSAIEEYGSCLVRLKQMDKAAAVLGRASDAHPDNKDLRYELADIQLKAKHAGEAIETLAPLLHGEEADDRVLELAASAYEEKGDTPNAVASLRKAIVQAPRNTDLYLDFADLCIQHQSFDAGVDMINAGLAIQPEAAPLYLARGVLYVQMARFDDAQADFEKADTLDPRHSFGAAALGLQAVQQHDPDQALNTVRQKLNKKPNDPFLLYLQADILSQKGPESNSPEFQTAVRSAAKAVLLQPTLVSAHDLLAKLYLQAGENEKAVQQCRKALDNDPKDQTAVYHLIQALRKTGQKEELPALLKRLAQLRQQATEEERERNRYKLVVEQNR